MPSVSNCFKLIGSVPANCQPCEDVYGPISSGALEVEGYLRRLQFTFNFPEQPFETFRLSVLDHEDDNGQIEMRTIGASRHKYDGNLFKLVLDAPVSNEPIYIDDETILDCDCLFITTRNWAELGRDIECLLLKCVRDNEGGRTDTFTRLGTLYLTDLYALKMRYKVKLDTDTEVNDEFWDLLQKSIKRAQDEKRILEEKEKEHTQHKDQNDPNADDYEQETSTISRSNAAPAVWLGNSSRGIIETLYQFDDPINNNVFSDCLCIERLSPQFLTII